MNKKIIFWALGTVVICSVIYFLLGTLNKKKNQIESKKIKVGISQITTHAVFDEISKGIRQGFKNAGYIEGKNIEFDLENAQGDASINSSIAQKFANGNYDLIIPLGTQASQAVANIIKEKPIVFGAVSDPVNAGLVKSKETPGGNITGTIDAILFKKELELLKQLNPEVKKIGIVYNPGEDNAKSTLRVTENLASNLNLEVITATVNSSGEILGAARSLSDKIDAFFMIVDNTVVSGQEALVSVALEAKKPLIAIDQSGVEKGGLATLGTNFEKVGEKTAEIGVRVLNGEKPGSISVLDVIDADLFINTKTAQSIGLNIPDELLNKAKQIYK